MIGIPLTKKVKGKPDKLIMPIAHYSVVGKTNSDNDRAILKDLTGNGNDLTLYNFAFTSESGYNGAGGLVFDGVDDYGKNNNFPQLKKFTIIYKRSISRDIIMTAPLFSKKNENITGEFVTEYMRKSVDGNKVILHYSFIEPILKDGEEVVTYEYDSKILKDILESEEWKSKEIEQNGIETTQIIQK